MRTTPKYEFKKRELTDIADITATEDNWDKVEEELDNQDTALASHLAETAQDNVHGLGDRPMVSTGDKTYYIDGTNGSDSNDGLTTATAFKTWDKARKQIPMFLSHTYIIRIIGNLAEVIDIPPVFCKGGVFLRVRGNTETASNHKVSGIKIGACGGGTEGFAVGIYYLQSSGEINVDGANYVVIYSCNPRNSGGMGVFIRGSSAIVSSCDFGTNVVQDAIVASDSSIVVSHINQGNATRYGLASYAGAIICKGDGGQPMGTTANEYKASGGQIFS